MDNLVGRSIRGRNFRVAAALISLVMALPSSALAADPLPPMTAEEIQAEIEAYRAQERNAAGT